MKILVTGFDPFGGEVINPSIEAVKQLPDYIKDVEIVKLEIPTKFHTSLGVIEEAILLHQPDVVLSIGQAGGRSDVSVERIGINVDDARICDNAGVQSIDEPIFVDGPDAYFVNVPIKAMVEAIRSSGVPASISNTAGTFVCNHVTYGVRHLIETKYPHMRSGFIHIPYLPIQVVDKKQCASMSLDQIVKAIQVSIETIIDVSVDIKKEGGTIC